MLTVTNSTPALMTIRDLFVLTLMVCLLHQKMESMRAGVRLPHS